MPLRRENLRAPDVTALLDVHWICCTHEEPLHAAKFTCATEALAQADSSLSHAGGGDGLC